MYVTKANGIMAVQSSDNVVAEELGGLMSKAEDGEIASIDYIGGQLRFIRNGLLYCYDPDTDKVTSYPAGDGAFDGTAVYCTNGTKSGYIWSAYDKDTDKGRIVASMSTDTGYSNPVTICETSGVVSRYLAPVLTEKGDWNIALNQENTQSGIHSLTWLCQEEKQDIRLVSAYVNENDVVNGLTGVDYVFTNTGDAAAHQMTAQITFADGTTVEKSVTVDAQPGETVSGTFYADFSQVDKGQNVRIAMFESGQQPKDENTVADVVEKNNLSLVGTAAEEAGKIKVTAYVTNKEKQSADADITLYGDKDKKNPLASQKGFMIPAGQTKQVVFTVEPELIQYNENQAAYLTLYAEAVGGDYDLADNVAYLALYQGEKVNANTEEKGMKEPVVKPEPTSLPTKTPEPQNTMPTKASNAIQKPAFTETPVPASTPMPNGTKVKDKKGVTYTITKSGQSKGEAAYTAPKSKKITSAVIPNTVKIGSTTYTVTSIRANAFKSCKKLKKITIGKEIKVIGKNAFYGCAKLKNIIIKTTKLTNKKVGAKAFAKLHKKVKIKVPKKKLSAYKKLLKKKGVTGKKQMIKK